MQDNMKRNNIRIIGIPEGEEEEQGIENLFEKKNLQGMNSRMDEAENQISALEYKEAKTPTKKKKESKKYR